MRTEWTVTGGGLSYERERIVTAINNAKSLSLLADETQDQAKHKLLQVTVCYVERTADNKWVLKNKIHYV